MQNLNECGHERRAVMTEQNRSSFAVATFYTTSALVTALGLAILITSATIAYMVAPCTALIVVACPESGAIPVAVGVLIHPDRTHPVPIAAAGLARVGSAEILGIVLSPFVPALLDAIAIAILISGLPRLGAITALIVVVVIITLRACQSTQCEGHRDKKYREFDLSRHDFGHLRSAADLPLLLGMRERFRFDALENL